MAGIPLAAAFVQVRPDTDRRAFEKEGDAAGRAAGQKYADGFYRDSAGKLRQANGRFATDAQKQMIEGGRGAGRGFGNSFNKEGGGIISRGFKKLRGELGPLLVPLGIAGAITAIGKIGIEYENNLNILQAVTKATGAQMSQVAEKARQLGADINLPGVSAAGAAKAMTELSKAGFTVQQSMDAARGTLQLARIAHIEEGEAAGIAAAAVNAFGIAAGDVNTVVDELAATANSSSVEISDVSASFKMAASVFSAFQGPAVGSQEAITELNTAIAILGNNGIRGSDAGTSLKQMLLQLTGPTKKAQNVMEGIALAAYGAAGGSQEFFMEVKNGKGGIDKIDSGLSLYKAALTGTQKQQEGALQQLQQLNPSLNNIGSVAFDAAGKMRSLPQILSILEKGLKGATQEERAYAITQVFGADASRSVIALMKGGMPAYEAMRKAVLEQGAAGKVAAAQNKGLGGAIDNVKGQFENAAISIYNQVKGPLTTGLNSVAALLAPLAAGIERFGNFVRVNGGTLRDWAVAIGAVTIALKLNSAVLAVQAAGGLLQAIKGIGIVTRVTRGWAAAQTLLNASLLLNPIGVAIVAIVALGAALVLAYRHSETFRNIVNAVWGAIKTAISATVGWITGSVVPWLKKAWDGIAAGAMWLWHKAIEPVWNGIKAVIGFVIGLVRGYIGLLVAEFRIVAAAATWLWRNIFAPVFSAIGKIVEIWWLAVRVVFLALYKIIRFTIVNAIQFVAGVFSVVFAFIKNNVITPWWRGMQVIFGLFRAYVLGPLSAALTATKNFFIRIFSAVGNYVKFWWGVLVSPVFALVRKGWSVLADWFSNIYNNKIKPLFNLFTTFIKTTVVGSFRASVEAIRTAWDKVREYARKPVAFVVNKVINPFIGGLNKAAAIVGIKDRVAPISGFAEGGRIPGYANGGRITGAPSSTDNRLAPARIPGVGAVKLAGGEFVVNARDTMKALPLLKWINAGMKGGGRSAARRIGRPVSQFPGDGSEGWQFAKGGLVGWANDVWSAIADPVGTLKKPFDAVLSQIPGVGMIKDFLVGAAKKAIGGAVNWLKGFGGSGDGTFAYHGPKSGRIGAAAAFVRAQEGKPYVWASAGPGGYDCSGIVSAAYNILKGDNPYRHTFSTGSLPGGYFKPGTAGPLVAGWSNPGQAPAGASVGHMAGNIAGLAFESTGSAGVRVGSRARGVNQFAHLGYAALANGGLLSRPVQVFDQGGPWRSGTLGANLSGRTEYVDPNKDGGRGGDTYHFHSGAFSGAVMSSSQQAEDLVVTAIKSAKRKRRL